jgi:SIR2-like domain
MSNGISNEFTQGGGSGAATSGPPSPLVDIPSNLLESVKQGECILFLGAMAHAPSPHGGPYVYENAPPSGRVLSERLATRCNYPFDDRQDLARVSLYFRYAENQNRESLLRAMRQEVLGNNPLPSPALHMLAALPFPIVITTNYDNLFDIALARANTLQGRPKQVQLRTYKPGLHEGADRVPKKFTEEFPVLLKLHGDFDHPDSIVVTENDYLKFIQKMNDQVAHPIQLSVRSQMGQWPVLFIGYSLRDYNFRLLMSTLRAAVTDADWQLYFSVDPKPDGVIALVSLRDTEFTISFIRQDLWTFVPALYEACLGHAYQDGMAQRAS